jgi:hypothetical protein
MVFPEFESGAGRKPMKTMARGGPRTRRILGAGGTLSSARGRAASMSIVDSTVLMGLSTVL